MSIQKGIKNISIEPNEIILGQPDIKLQTEVAMNRESGANGLQVRGQLGRVKMKGGKQLSWVPEKPLRAGRYELIVGETNSEDLTRITEETVIPFYVTKSRSPIKPSVVVESVVRIAIRGLGTKRLPTDTLQRGSYIEMIKGRNRKSGKPVSLAFDQEGTAVNADQIFKDLEARRKERYGKLHPTLFNKIQKGNGRLPVALWLKTSQKIDDDVAIRLRTKPVKRDLAVMQKSRAKMVSTCESFAQQVEAIGGRKIGVGKHTPVVHADLSAAAIHELSKQSEVAGIYLRDSRGVVDLDDSIAVHHSDNVIAAGFSGNGVKVAVFEEGPDDTSNLAFAGRFDTSPPASNHARMTSGIVKNTESGTPNGHAPDCNLYSANSFDNDALTWAVDDMDCTVISQSFHRGVEEEDGMSYDDNLKDYMALHWPYPTIVHAAGNNSTSPTSEYVNHKGYNTLSIGNHNDNASTMSATSVSLDPTSTHGDRELPELCANGTGVTVVGLTNSGTSFAAPAVAGIVAQLQEKKPVLKHWPEACRALLLAGAKKNVSGSTWWDDVSSGTNAADGSGSVDALESYRIAGTKVEENNDAVRRGWDMGLLTTSDFTTNRNSTFSYKILVPESFLPFHRPTKVKVALAWTSDVDSSPSSNLAVDLDLRIYNSAGIQVGYSGSWDNSYEIAEFTGIPGEEYDIRIRRWSGTQSTWYGIAWTVTGGLSIFELTLSQVMRLQEHLD